MSNEFALIGKQLGVRFFAAGDRYAHAISLGSEEHGGMLLESVEGKPEDAWPPSPVLQSCHVENLPNDRRVALLVGMAGRSHWSLAAELIAENGTDRLVFDVACRVSAPMEYLGNRYRLGSAARWDREIHLLNARGGTARIVVGSDEARAEVRQECSAGEIEIVPCRWEPAPATIRWKFEVAVSAV